MAKKSLESCSEGHPWRPLVVLPGCRLCSNPTHTVHVPVLPIQRHAKENSAPFSICKKPDHQQCYVVAKTTDPAHPHSVEELVIWTVERERCECTFLVFSVQIDHIVSSKCSECSCIICVHIYMYVYIRSLYCMNE